MSVFTVLPSDRGVPRVKLTQVLLIHSNWDDWFTYSTLYDFWYWTPDAEKYEHIGSLKIGEVGMGNTRTPNLPESFASLDKEKFFSLGTDEEYYENLERKSIRMYVLERLNDIAFSPEAFEIADKEAVTHSSLLRNLSKVTVLRELRRIAQGGSVRTQYRFRYEPPLPHLPILKFNVDPTASPPNNIHIFIGRNGVGKTTFLRLITAALLGNDRFGRVTFDQSLDNSESIMGVVSVSFSAFDRFPAVKADPTSSVKYQYVGLKREVSDAGGELDAEAEEILSASTSAQSRPSPILKNHEELTKDFVEGLYACMEGVRRDRWRAAVRKLYSDPIFQEVDIETLSRKSQSEMKTSAEAIFTRLSSGHQIVLYTLTKLVQLVQDRVLVLIDEPECHLHPPLLSAFTRALSEMLAARNAVSIIATHSPVILQEVPSESVYIFNRSGRQVSASRPDRECFGENVGILTHDIFGLEVTESGFHQLIRDQARKLADFDAVTAKFGNKLGGEALALAQVLVSRRKKEIKEFGE